MSNAAPNKFFIDAGTRNAVIAEAVGQFHRSVYDKLEAEQKGQWVFATVGEGLELDNERTIRGYAMDLYKILPVPSNLASFADIIEFKKHERSALLDLRAELGAMYIQIASCPDKDFALNLHTEKVKKSIPAVQVLLNKRGLRWSSQSVEVELNPADWVSAAMDGDDARQHLEKWGLSSTWSTVAGVALSAGLIIKRKMLPSLGRESGVHAFRYAFNAGRDEILDANAPWAPDEAAKP